MNNKDISSFSKGFLVFFIFVLCFIYMTGQLSTPYIRHDDWEFMIYLLPDMPHHGTPWDKTLWEGRWINYLWSFIARDYSVNTNYLFFIVGYSLFSWSVGFYFSTKQLDRLLISIASFFCSAYADLSLWPATLSPSIWLLFFIVLLFKFYRNNWLLIIFFPLLVMSYAPLVAVCFILLFSNFKSSFREKVKFGFIYYIGYVFGVLIIYILNYKYHGFLGVQVAEWRHPNPLVSFESFIVNFKKLLGFWIELVKEYKIYIVFSLVLSFFLIKNGRKENLLNLYLSLFFIIVIESSLSLYTGVDIPVRAIIWPWFFFVSMAAISLSSINIKNRSGGLLLLILLISYGFGRWYEFYTYESKHARFEEFLGATLRSQEHRDVYVCGDVKLIMGLGGRELRPLTLALWKKDGIYLKQASAEECQVLSGSKLGLHNINSKTFYKFN
ncbi:MAG: hypothetical protein E6Y14_05235 [Haemophilus parainfluenzae]|jgi:hypothetical protein|nr:hypothetical protein [Haemophilus parainfluenzae]